MLRILLLVVFIQVALSLRLQPAFIRSARNTLYVRRRDAAETPVETKPTFVVGESIPDEISKHKCIYDMILVERYSMPEKTTSGLFMPVVEGKDQRHVGKVLSMPAEYGLESEQGRIRPVEEIAPFSLGDVVYIKVSAMLCRYYLFSAQRLTFLPHYVLLLASTL
jgi:co-chaperonin GroES (HSP10)